MLGIHDVGLFIIAGWVLNITPGPDMLLIAGRSVAQGFRAGAAAAFGIAAGCLVHTAAVALGFAALLATSALAFDGIKLAGAAYLVYLGLKLPKFTQAGRAKRWLDRALGVLFIGLAARLALAERH